MLFQAWNQHRQIARAGAMVELIFDDVVPAGFAGTRRAGQAEQIRTIGGAGQRAGLQRRGFDFVKGDHAEHFTETLDLFVQQWLECLGGAIATGHPGATGTDHHVYLRIGNPARDHGSDLVDVIGRNSLFSQAVAGVHQAGDQHFSGGVFYLGAGVGDGEDGNFQGNEFTLCHFGGSLWFAGEAIKVAGLYRPSSQEKMGIPGNGLISDILDAVTGCNCPETVLFFTMEKIMTEATARHILVSSEERCLELKNEIEAGADFGEIAKQNSSCPSGAQGGDLGSFGPGMMVPEFDKVVFSADLNTVQGPVKTQFGYHLLEVTSRTD